MVPEQILFVLPALSANENQEKLFLRDPKADLYLMYRENIFPLHRELFEKCQKVISLPPGEKFLIFDEPLQFDISMLQQVLKLFYGTNLTLYTNKQVQHCSEILSYLDHQELNAQLENALIQNLPSLDTFFILSMAHTLSMRKLKKKCFQYLAEENFQQMLYNKYDFLNCQFLLFEKILKIQKSLRKEKMIQGIDREQVENACWMYGVRWGISWQLIKGLIERYGREDIGYEVLKQYESKYISQNQRKRKNSTTSLASLGRKKFVESKIIEEPHDLKHQKFKAQEKKLEHSPEAFPTFPPIQEETFSLSYTLPIKQSIEIPDPEHKQSPFKSQTSQMSEYDIAINGVQQNQHSKQESLQEIIEEMTQIERSMNNTRSQFSPNQKSEIVPEKYSFFVNNSEFMDEKSSFFNQKSVIQKPSTPKVDIQTPQITNEQEAEVIVSKISDLLNQYQTAYQKHDINLQTMKQQHTLKSVVFQQKQNRYSNTHKKQPQPDYNRKLFPNLVKSIFQTQRFDQ